MTYVHKKRSIKVGERHIHVNLIISFVAICMIITNAFPPLLSAAPNYWTQTDWSGGAASGLVTGTTDTFQESSNAVTSNLGEVSVTPTDGWTEDLSEWAFRRKVTFDNSTAHLSAGVPAEALVNYPVLVKLTGGINIDYTKTQDAGEDIRFVDADGTTLLAHEIESWDESGSSFVWVNVPQIDANSNTDYIYMYYGNDSVLDGQSRAATWNSNFRNVWHFAETTGNYIESSRGRLGTYTANVIRGHAGPIGKAVSFSNSTPTSQDYISANATDVHIAEKTISFWANPDDLSRSNNVIASLAAANWYVNFSGGGLNRMHLSYSNASMAQATAATGNGVVTAGSWSYYNYVWDVDGSNVTLRFYKDGFYIGEVTNTTGVGSAATYGAILYLGNFSNSTANNFYLKGGLDEFTVTDDVKSLAYIKATYLNHTDDFSTYSTEEPRYSTSSYVISNIFDSQRPSNWDLLSYTGSETGISIKARTSNSEDMSDASEWAVCTPITNETDPKTGDCVTDTHQYFQYRVDLTAGVTSPVLQDITLEYSTSDTDRPSLNASDIEMTGAEDGEWTRTAPLISWSAGQDEGLGLLGYCIALDEAPLDQSNTLNPESQAGKLTGLNDGVAMDVCPYIVTDESIDLAAVSGLTLVSGQQYNFSIKAVDVAGNVWTGDSELYQDLVSFKYDNAPPTPPAFISLPGGFVSDKAITITWPTAGDNRASDADSGLAGLQYRIGVGGTWYGEVHNGLQDSSDLLADDGSYTMDPTTDYPNLVEGENVVHFRAVDNVGNVSSLYVAGVIKLNTIAPSSVQNLSVAPQDNTVNSYSFDWDPPAAFSGSEANLTYCYTVMVLPSASSCTFTTPGSTNLAADAYATQPGTNIFYIVAKDEAGNINYATYTAIEFTYSGSAPGIPTNVELGDISTKATSNWRLALSWGVPQNTGAGITNYRVYRSTSGVSCTSDFAAFSEVSTAVNASYIDSDLSQQTYYYCVKACDSANACSAPSETVSGTPTGRYTEPSVLTSQPVVFSRTTRKAVINWGTDRNSDSKIQYGIASGSYFAEEIYNSVQTTAHSVTLNNLVPGTVYYYRAKWTDEDGNTGISDEKSFVTLPAPDINEVEVLSVGIDRALIKFKSTSATGVHVLYGRNGELSSSQTLSTSLSESTYTVLLENLLDGTTYEYKLNPIDADGFEYQGTTLQFTTLPRPRVMDIQVQEVKESSQPTIQVTWKSNTPISSIITYYPETNPGDVKNMLVTDLTLEHDVKVEGLLPNTRYALTISGIDGYANKATSDVYLFSTASDSRPPSINNIKLTSEATTVSMSDDKTGQIIVSWETDEPASAQVEYGVGTTPTYEFSTQHEGASNYRHLIIISGLHPASVYHMRIVARDEAGNTSRSHNLVVVTSRPQPDPLQLVLGKLAETFRFLR